MHVRRVAAEQGRTICILQDLQDPRFARETGRAQSNSAEGWGKEADYDHAAGCGGHAGTSVDHVSDPARDVEVGGRILFSDGRIELRVAAINGTDSFADIINGSKLAEHQGSICLGRSERSCLTRRRGDLAFGLRNT